MPESKEPQSFAEMRQDKRRIKLRLPEMEIDADGLTILIESLGKARAEMLPAFDSEPPLAHRERIAPLVAYRVLRNVAGPPLEAGFLLAVQAREYGWMDYPIPPAEAQALLLWLTNQGQQLAPPPGTTLN